MESTFACWGGVSVMSLKSSSMRRPAPPGPPPRMGVWADAAVAPSASRTVSSNAYRLISPPHRVRVVGVIERLRLRSLDRCVLEQLDVDPHRVRVRPHAHPLVCPVDPAQIVLPDRGPDEAQHIGGEPGVVARV